MKQGEPVPVVKVGQVWESVETRRVWKASEWATETTMRTLHVLELVGHGQFGAREPGARCHVVETGRKVIVALRRMKPGKTRGYRLLSEGPTNGTD